LLKLAALGPTQNPMRDLYFCKPLAFLDFAVTYS